MTKEVKLIPRQIREADFPTARFLSEEDQNRYEQACQQFSSESARRTLNIPQNGSNLFKVLLLNQTGIRTATLPELELAFENGLDLRGTYEDGREVILRSKEDPYKPNDSLTKDLAKKLKLKCQIKTPLIVTDLEITEAQNSTYGLVLMPTNRTQVIEAHDFDFTNNGKRFRTINSDYTIEFDDNASSVFCAKQYGLSRLCLDRDLVLDSYFDVLAVSGDVGRVVVVGGEATSQNLEQCVTRLQNQKDNQIAELQERHKKAERYLRTGNLE